MMPGRIVSRGVLGRPAIVRMQDRADRLAERCEWPRDYPDLVPPPDADPVHQINQPVVVPAFGATATVLTYIVPDGMRFFMPAIIQNFSGSNFNPGDLLWTLTTNELPGGVDLQGAPVEGLISLPVPLGAWQFGVKWKFPKPYDFAPNTVIRSMCTNATGVIPSAIPNYLISGFFGFLVNDTEVPS